MRNERQNSHLTNIHPFMKKEKKNKEKGTKKALDV